MAILRFNEYFGTTNADKLLSYTNSTTFGLSGNDELSSVSFSEYNFLAGGSGNDTYNVGYGSATAIVDTGGSDHVVALSLGFNDPDTYVATVDGGKHILARSTASGTQLGIANWQSSSNSIESITLSDGTYSMSFISSVLYGRPNYIGDISTEQLVSYGVLPQGTTSFDLQEFINYVSLRESTFRHAPTIENYDPSGIYRFFNQSTGAHFYTNSKNEAENVMATLPHFAYEGLAFKGNTSSSSDSIDIFRFYNTNTNTHFYTGSSTEAESVRNNLPNLIYEGVAYQAHNTKSTGTTELYRFYNTHTGTHFYTASQAEMENVKISMAGVMDYEGVAYFVDI